MPKKYHIHVKPTSLELDLIAKFQLERGEECINCGRCIKACVYEAHKRREDDPRKMADPINALCKNCFRCIQECPRGAMIKSIMPEFKTLGDEYWKSDMILSTWKQAEDGKVPVTGAGYRGKFTGPGFDSMWTDMSEIVRPTRDGIHGREYISTHVDLGRKLDHLEFGANGELLSDIPDTVDLPIPIIFDSSIYDVADIVKAFMAGAAEGVDTLAIFPASGITGEIEKCIKHIIPLLSYNEIEKYYDLLGNVKVLELYYTEELLSDFESIRKNIKKVTDALVAVRIPASAGIEDTVLALAQKGAEIVHIITDHHGKEQGDQPRFVKEVLEDVHNRLTKEAIRDELTLIVSGGIAMAEHVPKAIISGADVVSLDIPMILALGYELHGVEKKLLIPPKEIDRIEEQKGIQRIVNLIGAWHSQILEVMGAMGIREVRRLRGEMGRAIYFETLEKETFAPLFGNKS